MGAARARIAVGLARQPDGDDTSQCDIVPFGLPTFSRPT